MSSTFKLPPGDYAATYIADEDITAVVNRVTGVRYEFEGSVQVTATEIHMLEQQMGAKLERLTRSLLMGDYRFSPKFLEVHRDRLEQNYYTYGNIFEIQTLEPLKYSVSQAAALQLSGALSIVGVHAREENGTLIFRPFSWLDNLCAETWDVRNAKIPLADFAKLPEASIPE